MKRLGFIAVAGAALLVPNAAQADPGPASEVYSPAVTQGGGELELRGGQLNGGPGDGDWQLKAEASYGVTDWWRPAVVVEWEDEGAGADVTAWAIENVFDFTATRAWPVRLGGYVEYEFANDGPNELELKLLMQRQRGPVGLRLNLIATRLLGSAPNDNWEFGYAAQGSYAFNDDFALGIQGFGDAGTDQDFGLNDQASYWGPFAQVELGHVGKGEVELQAGYLVGAGDAEADGIFRLKVEYEFGATSYEDDGDR